MKIFRRFVSKCSWIRSFLMDKILSWVADDLFFLVICFGWEKVKNWKSLSQDSQNLGTSGWTNFILHTKRLRTTELIKPPTLHHNCNTSCKITSSLIIIMSSNARDVWSWDLILVLSGLKTNFENLGLQKSWSRHWSWSFSWSWVLRS